MNPQDQFSAIVRKHFGYLIDEFGFAVVEDQYRESSAAYAVAFQNNIRQVKLIWDLKDEEFYFGVHRVLSDGEPAPYRDGGTHHFYISNLAAHYEPGLDVKFLNVMDPYHPDLLHLLDEKIRANAQLLRKYGTEILAGRQWFDPMGK